MQEIITGIKRDDGIIVVWQEGDEIRTTPFLYSELIEQKINALDLLEHPKMYLFDEMQHRLMMK